MPTSPNFTAKLNAKRCHYYVINDFTKGKKLLLFHLSICHTTSAMSIDTTLIFNLIEAKHADIIKLLAQQQDKVQIT